MSGTTRMAGSPVDPGGRPPARPADAVAGWFTDATVQQGLPDPVEPSSWATAQAAQVAPTAAFRAPSPMPGPMAGPMAGVAQSAAPPPPPPPPPPSPPPATPARDAFGRLVVVDLSGHDPSVHAPAQAQVRVFGSGVEGGLDRPEVVRWDDVPSRRRSGRRSGRSGGRFGALSGESSRGRGGRTALVAACVAATLGVGGAVVVATLNQVGAQRVEIATEEPSAPEASVAGDQPGAVAPEPTVGPGSPSGVALLGKNATDPPAPVDRATTRQTAPQTTKAKAKATPTKTPAKSVTPTRAATPTPTKTPTPSKTPTPDPTTPDPTTPSTPPPPPPTTPPVPDPTKTLPTVPVVPPVGAAAT